MTVDRSNGQKYKAKYISDSQCAFEDSTALTLERLKQAFTEQFGLSVPRSPAPTYTYIEDPDSNTN